MSNAPRQSKNERRDAAREKAREQRLRQQRRERRNRVVLQFSIGAVVIAIVAIIALVIVNSVKTPGPGPRNMASGGITIGEGFKAVTTGAMAAKSTPSPAPSPSGKVVIQAWEDFGCPICNAFETANGTQIAQLVSSGAAVVEYFPVAILDTHFSDGDYSTRAANAAAAVANYSPDDYYKFHQLLYKDQPSETGPGLTNAKLASIAKEAGVTNLAAITKAINDKAYATWVSDRTNEFTSDGGALSSVKFPASHTSAGTPTVIVNGQFYDGDPSDAAAFGSFVTKVGGSIAASPTPTPSPSASK